MVLKDKNSQTILVKCDCHCSGYEISKWEDEDSGVQYFISPVVYTYDVVQKEGRFWFKLMSRIQAVVNILRFGVYKSNEITIGQDTYTDLIDAMIELDGNLDGNVECFEEDQ